MNIYIPQVVHRTEGHYSQMLEYVTTDGKYLHQSIGRNAKLISPLLQKTRVMVEFITLYIQSCVEIRDSFSRVMTLLDRKKTQHIVLLR